MNTPQRSEETGGERRLNYKLSMLTAPLTEAPSWGERLLPYLMAAMESCWVGAIFIGMASINVFQSHALLMPLWTPFIFMAGTYWLSTYLERREIKREEAVASEDTRLPVGSSSVFVLVGLFALYSIWSSVYAATIPIYDPNWLGALLGDLFSLNLNAFRIACVVGLALYFCWRGLRLARRLIEPSDVFATMRVGVGVILAVIVIRAAVGASFFDESLLLFLVPLFLALALLTHALARAFFMRRSHPAGLQGSVVAQERSLLTVIGSIGFALICFALIVGTFASPTFLAQVQEVLSPLGRAYDWLVSILAYALVFLMAPIFWLLSVLHFSTPQLKPPKVQTQKQSRPPVVKKSSPTPEAVVVATIVLKILLPLLLLVLAVILIRLALRRRRVQIIRHSEDVHESLWSWELFKTQLLAFLRALWLRFFPAHPVAEEQVVPTAISGEPTARSIREMYRALLQWSAQRGLPRRKDETPSEFKRRLGERLPVVEPELGTVTEAYNAIRYGEAVPSEAEVARVQGQWRALQEKSQTP